MADINTEPADDSPETVTTDEPAPVVATTVTADEPAPVVATTTVSVASEPAGAEVRPNRRKIREGLVLSVAMDKTAVVGVVERVRHPRYAKTVQRTKAFYAHDPNNDLRVGDRVRIAETRPMSKLKRWRIVDVLERAK
jgi:small subunit ribosomal protein S17